MSREDVRRHVNAYCLLRDVQFAAYELYARRWRLTAKEWVGLDLLGFAPDGCLHSDICERLSATKQTVSAIIKKFREKGYVSPEESEADRRNKIIRLTDAGRAYTARVIPPAASAEIDAMAELPAQEMAELVRLTTAFSHAMKRRFDALPEVET